MSLQECNSGRVFCKKKKKAKGSTFHCDGYYMETVPLHPILPSEVRDAIKRLKRNKAPGEDNITAGILQDGGEPIVKIFTKLFNRCIVDGKVPSCWKNASVIIIHKKEDMADTKN